MLPVSGVEGSGHLPIGPDGNRGERMARPNLVEWEPWALMARGNGGSRQQSVPYSPETVWARTPSGALVQASSDEYRIEVRNPDGTVLLIVRDVEALPVSDVERAWHESVTGLRMKSVQPDWERNANPIPETKPFFTHFHSDPDGVFWVRRLVRTESVNDCDASPAVALAENRPARPCFREIEGFDVFAVDGRYLGQVEMPPVDLVEQPTIDGDTLVLALEDESGTIMVKRYRLVLPGEQNR